MYLHAWAQEEVMIGRVQLSNHSSEPITAEACYVIHDSDKSDEYWMPWRLGQTQVNSERWPTTTENPGFRSASTLRA